MDVKRLIKGMPEYDRVYSMANDWWKFWKFPVPNVEFLPQSMICAYIGDRPISIGFLYSTDSKISWLEFVVADPKSGKQERADAIEKVICSAKFLAGVLGFDVVFTSSKNQSLNNKLKKQYTETDVGMTHFIGRI